ncbi:hypothetical protein FRB95_001456 [Tulasnella sp. JGI-2019a]|nr:hypothetical protein FRB95_001456 [Tulasnella sp. JGI-2019a]
MAHLVPHRDQIYAIELQEACAEVEEAGADPLGHEVNIADDLLPLEPTFNCSFDDTQRWAFLPTGNVLLLHIAFEEQYLLYRGTANPDLGRLLYSSSHIHFPAASDFNAYFVDSYRPFATYENDVATMQYPPTFPERRLIASVNIIVSRAPEFIASLNNSDAVGTTPASSLIVFTIEEAEAYLNTGRTLNNGEILEMGTSELDDSPDKNPDSTSNDGSLQLSAQEFNSEDNIVGSGGFSANDWAFYKYDTLLGGPILIR